MTAKALSLSDIKRSASVPIEDRRIIRTASVSDVRPRAASIADVSRSRIVAL